MIIAHFSPPPSNQREVDSTQFKQKYKWRKRGPPTFILLALFRVLYDRPLGQGDWWFYVRIVLTLLTQSYVTLHYHLMMMLNINNIDILKCLMILIILIF